MLDEVTQQLVRESLLVGPARITEDSVERAGVSLLDLPEGVLNGCPDVRGLGAYVAPVAAFRYLKAVILREESVVLIPAGLF